MNMAEHESGVSHDPMLRRVAVICGGMTVACALAAGWFFLSPSGDDVVAEAVEDVSASAAVDDTGTDRKACVNVTAMSIGDDGVQVCFVQEHCTSPFTVTASAVTGSGSVVTLSDGTKCSASAEWSPGSGTEVKVLVPLNDNILYMVDGISVTVDGAEYVEGNEFDLFESARRMRASKVGIAAVDAARETREQLRVARREAEARRAAEEAARKKAEEEAAANAANAATNTSSVTNTVTADDSVTNTVISPVLSFDVSALMATYGSSTGIGVVVDISGRGAYVLQVSGDTWSVIASGDLWCDSGQSGTFTIVRKAPGAGNACSDGFGADMSAFVESFSAEEAFMMGHETIIFDGMGHWIPMGICAGDMNLSGTSMEHTSDGSIFVDPELASVIFDNVPVGSTVIVM